MGNKTAANKGSVTVLPPNLEKRDILRATKMKISLDEYARRDKMVRDAFKACPFSVNEVVIPRTEENNRLYGECRIIGITHNYFEYGGLDDEWDDIPRILTFECINPRNDQTNKVYHGTINWFNKAC